ncbi:MAG: carboxymuconolactone decarboxylase family protein [Promethearchaeota archaeon]
MNTKLIKEITRNIGPHGRVRLSKPRIPPMSDEEYNKKWEKLVNESEWAKEVQFLIDKTISNKGRNYNVFKGCMEHQESFMRYLMWLYHILFHLTLPDRDREILILRIGWLCGSEYEWAQHKIIGAMSGLKTKEIRRITEGPDAEGWDPFDATLIRAVDELYKDCFISEPTWKALAERYDKRQLIDLISTVGMYEYVCMFLNTLGVPLDEGFTGFPKKKTIVPK